MLNAVGGILSRLVDAVAPLVCAGCGEPRGAHLCPACVDILLGEPPTDGACPTGMENVDAAWAAFHLRGTVREVLHAGKYQGRTEAMDLVGALAAERLATAALPRPSAVVPVPLPDRRRRTRGYNQAEIVAARLARWVALPIWQHLVRLRDTAPQVGLSAFERRGNLRGAFAWRGPPLRGEAVWLVDDVLTTGATVSAAAGALRDAGCDCVHAVVVAVATEPGAAG